MLKEIFPDTNLFKLKARIWVEAEDERFIGPGPIELLEKIILSGSIAKASTAMGMSYQKAWRIINNLNSKAVRPLVITQAGGNKGGGALVTEEGQKVITFYKELQTRLRHFLEQEQNMISKSS